MVIICEFECEFECECEWMCRKNCSRWKLCIDLSVQQQQQQLPISFI